jgi:nitrate reductase assembly molybdenum cofactor insertion protein NarJ
MLKHQLADYERTLAAFIQQVERSNQSYATAIDLFRNRWDK